jgi:hypothetical protein
MGLPFVARIVGGIVLVAMVVGVGLWAERQTDDELALPDEFGGEPLNDSEVGQAIAEANDAALSEVYDGADAVAAVYGEDTKTGLLVTAVRAGSGPLAPPVFSESEHWIEDGDVTCLVTPAPKGPGTTQCQREDSDLTVRVVVPGKPDLDPLVEATNDLWEDLS